MQINVKLYGELKNYAPNDQTDFILKIEPGATLKDVLNMLSIPIDSHVSLIKGRRVANDVKLKKGDTLVLFPPVSGG